MSITVKRRIALANIWISLAIVIFVAIMTTAAPHVMTLSHMLSTDLAATVCIISSRHYLNRTAGH